MVETELYSHFVCVFVCYVKCNHQQSIFSEGFGGHFGQLLDFLHQQAIL